MTDIEQKALAQAVEAAGRRMQDYNIMAEENVLRQSIEAHARAIEQHEAFRQEVSDAVEGYASMVGLDPKRYFARFIIAKPDPLVEALKNAGLSELAIEQIKAAIQDSGGRIVWEGE